MRKMILASALLSSVAFAAATEGGAAAATAKAPEDATPPTDSTPGNVNRVIEAITNGDQLDKLQKAMDSRTVYPSIQAAYDAMTKAGEATESFFGLPIAVVGYDEETDTVDESIYNGSNAVLAYVGARNIKIDGKDRNSVKAVVIYPVPTVESFLAGGDAASAWLEKIIQKEAGHVAFRNFRDANTLAELMNGAKAAPRSVDDYVTASNREGSGLDTETFDALWNSFRNMLKKEQPALNALLPSKADTIKAIRSKAFAESSDDTKPLEDAGIFVKIAQALINGAEQNKDKDGKPAPLDSTSIQDWLDGRDSLVLGQEKAKPKDFSILDSLNF